MKDESVHAASIFNKLADRYQERFMDVSLYHSSFDFFADHLPSKQPNVFEVACGPGNITNYILNKYKGINWHGTDLAPNMIELAKKNNPDAKFEVMDARTVGSLRDSFDGMMIGFCLPYLSREESIKLIKDATSKLIKGGVIYISSMEGDYSTSGYRKGSSGDEIFMHYHEAESIQKAMKDAGLQLVYFDRIQYPTGDELTTDMILIGEKLS